MKDIVQEKIQLESRVAFRLPEEKYRELQALVPKTKGVNNLSELLRKLICETPIRTVTYDPYREKILEVLSGFLRELKAIGVNINQVVRYFNGVKTLDARLERVPGLLRLLRQAEDKVREAAAALLKKEEG